MYGHIRHCRQERPVVDPPQVHAEFDVETIAPQERPSDFERVAIGEHDGPEPTREEIGPERKGETESGVFQDQLLCRFSFE